ncbi:MAG TPA: hypothetical protein VIL74_17805 [Pyrinomonadaceae bacterium]|jgi:hypothetical protein
MPFFYKTRLPFASEEFYFNARETRSLKQKGGAFIRRPDWSIKETPQLAIFPLMTDIASNKKTLREEYRRWLTFP